MGLHMADFETSIRVLRRQMKGRPNMVVNESDLDVIAPGPEDGLGGGKVVVAGRAAKLIHKQVKHFYCSSTPPQTQGKRLAPPLKPMIRMLSRR